MADDNTNQDQASDSGSPQTDWRIAGVKHMDQFGRELSPEAYQKQVQDQQSRDYQNQQGERDLEYWRQHHNDPAYRQMAESNAAQQAHVTEIREKAKFDAENFEKRYTTKQKAEIARINKAKSDLQSNPNFSDDEKKKGIHLLDMQSLGIRPSDLPKLSPHPKGQDIGDVWSHKESGALITRGADGRAHVLVRPDQTVEYKKAEGLNKIHQAELARQQKESDRAASLRSKMLFDETVDKDGNKKRRLRSPEELDAIMQAYSGQKKQPDPKQVVDDQEFVSKTMQKYGGFSHVPVELQKQLIEAGNRLRGQQPQKQEVHHKYPQSPGEPVQDNESIDDSEVDPSMEEGAE